MLEFHLNVVTCLRGIAVNLRLRLDTDVCQPYVKIRLREETQFAVGLVIGDCTAHHQFAEIARLDFEIPCGLRGGK